jgi:hypothetical protein
MADLTTEVLIEIREEIRATRRDLSERIDQTNTRLGRLEQRETESEVRVATELLAVVGAVNQLRDAILEDRELRRTVLGYEQRIAALEARSP